MELEPPTPEEEVAAWLAAHGVPTDEDGLPLRDMRPGPAKPCTRCGSMVEMPGEGTLSRGDRTIEAVFCDDCFKLMLIDREAFWRVLREKMGED